jgi:hypothetical protein
MSVHPRDLVSSAVAVPGRATIYHADFETRSVLELGGKNSVGAYRYAEDESTTVLCLSYRKDNGPVKRWRPGEPPPIDLLEHIADGGKLGAHNAAFERLIFNVVLPRMGYDHWPKVSIEQCDCTMIRAMALALPGKLEDLGPVLRLHERKDKEGSTLMKQMCKPRKAKKNEDPSVVYWIDDEASMSRLMDYCDQDVETETAADKKLLRLKDSEEKLWHLDQKINDRGVYLDLKNARKLMAIAKIVVAKADARMAILTLGAVTACTQAAAIAKWITSRGIHCASVAKGEVDEILKAAKWCGDDLVVEVLQLRREFAKASTAKITTMFRCVCADFRARGLLQFLGALTGRWAGRLLQPQNLPRVDAKEDLPRVEKVFAILEECGRNIVRAAVRIADEVGEVLPLISKCLRGLLMAAPDHKLVGGDLSNIEGRGVAWVSDEEWKLDMFRKVDAKEIVDPYYAAYSKAFGVPIEEVTKPQRQVGKIIELACFAAPTKVLTNHGIKEIIDVTTDDKLWDGVEWVKHGGMVARGAKPVVNVDGISVTPDHGFLVGRVWKPAQDLVSNECALSRALETGSASFPLLDRISDLPVDSVTSKSNAHAGAQRAKCPSETSTSDGPLAVIPALRRRPVDIPRTGGDTPISSPMTRTVVGCLTESRLASNVVTPRKMPPSRTTAAEESTSTILGGRIKARSSRISSRSKAGISQSSNSIERTLTKDTSPATFDSSRSAPTKATSEPLKNCSARSQPSVPVFDILNAGPRHRFTVISDTGAFIVHNCGYQGSIGAFVNFANEELLLSIVDTVKAAVPADVWEANWAKFKSRRDNCDLTQAQWTAIKITVDAWRREHPKTVQGWWDLQDAAVKAVSNPGVPVSVFGGKVVYVFQKSFLWCRLPSGRALAYFNPAIATSYDETIKCEDGKVRDVESVGPDELERLGLAGVEISKSKGRKVVEFEGYVTRKKGAGKVWIERVAGRKGNPRLYGGLQLENIVQAFCRDIMAHGMMLAEKVGLKIILTVHDELVAEVLKIRDDLNAALLKKCMTSAPRWLFGFPLAAACWEDTRYVK